VPGEQRVRRIVTSDAGEAGAFFERAIAAGQEGLMAKALEARYDAGARGAAWLKLKPAHTLDLVVLAPNGATAARGPALEPPPRRSRRGCRKRGLRDAGKTFKGMTDEMPGVADGEAARARDPTPTRTWCT